jgi:hypothetical protein
VPLEQSQLFGLHGVCIPLSHLGSGSTHAPAHWRPTGVTVSSMYSKTAMNP